MNQIKEKEVAVILNSFNRLELLKKSLMSVVKLSDCGINFILVIFDAGSTDGSIEFIEGFKSTQKFPVFTLKAESKLSSSFSYGVNAACKYASDQFPSIHYFFLFETDNYLHSCTAILNAITLLKGSAILAGCGFTVKKHDGTGAGFGSKFPSLLSFVLGQQFSFGLKLNRMPVRQIQKDNVLYFFTDVVYTSPIIIKKESWERVNGFDFLNFPFSDCDIDLAYRIQQAGERLAILKTNDVVHDNLKVGSDWSEKRTLSFYKARFTYFQKNYGKSISLLKPVLCLMHGLEFLVLVILLTFGKRNKNSVKTRMILMSKVWKGYS